MPFRKKVLYYGSLPAPTSLAVAGMVRVAYYAAYGQGYGGGLAIETKPPPPSINTRARS